MSGPALRILVADDHPADRDLTSEAVAEYGEGIELVLAATAAEAERIATTEPRPHLALIDLWLGPDSGRELLPRLGVPAVILTTTDNPAERELALAAGAIDFWIKPLQFEEYRELLGKARQLAQACRR